MTRPTDAEIDEAIRRHRECIDDAVEQQAADDLAAARLLGRALLAFVIVGILAALVF